MVHDNKRVQKPPKWGKAKVKKHREGIEKRQLTLAEEKLCALGIRVFIGHLMQELGQLRWATEKLERRCVIRTLLRRDHLNDTHHSDIGVRVLFDDGWEDAIPIGSTKMSRRTKRGNSVLVSSDVLDLKRHTEVEYKTLLFMKEKHTKMLFISSSLILAVK